MKESILFCCVNAVVLEFRVLRVAVKRRAHIALVVAHPEVYRLHACAGIAGQRVHKGGNGLH